MNSNCSQRLSILFVLLALTVPALQIKWQGTGTMTDSNMTEIHNNIDSHPITSITTGAQIDSIAQNISTRLNQLWAPAWNVFIVKSFQNFDTILYGYAFKNHWMWINGVLIPMTIDNSVTYIIWKDYNCQNWALMADLNVAGSGFTAGQLTQINSYTFTQVNTDVWLQAHDFVEHVNVQSTLNSGAYTAVMSQYASSQFYGYICLVNNNYLKKTMIQASNVGIYGSYFLFQTR